jgi:hypothetical protein
MTLERTAFATYTPAAAPARFRVEKANAGKRLDREERRKPRTGANAAHGRDTTRTSRFDTDARVYDTDIHPASGFAAQILGQMLAGETPDAAVAGRAYARATVRDTRTRSIRYA